MSRTHVWYGVHGYTYLLKTRNHGNTHCLGVLLFYAGVFKPFPLQTLLLLFACTPENICYSLKNKPTSFHFSRESIKVYGCSNDFQGRRSIRLFPLRPPPPPRLPTPEYGEIRVTLFVEIPSHTCPINLFFWP